ncbi:unnamed protein product [Prunus armeniaca]
MGLAVRQGHPAGLKYDKCDVSALVVLILNRKVRPGYCEFRRSRGRPTERTKELEPSLEIRFGILEFTGWVLVVRLSLSDLEL